MAQKIEVSMNREVTKTGEKQQTIHLWEERCHLVRRVDALELISVNSLTLALYLKEGPTKIEEVSSIDVKNDLKDSNNQSYQC